MTRKLPKKVKRARTADHAAAQKALAATKKTTAAPASSVKAVREQRDISGIIQEAAKGVYLQGEKWGVAKALRGAVQGIQTANATPRKATERSHWSLDNGKTISDSSSAELIARIEALEHRNKALAKLLENAVSELWAQQKARTETSNSEEPSTSTSTSTSSEDLGLAVARVQFVQVYLENSSMALPSSDSLSPTDEHEKQASNDEPRGQQADLSQRRRHQASSSLDGIVETSHVSNPPPTVASRPEVSAPACSIVHAANPPSTPNASHTSATAKSGDPPPPPSLQPPRPALAQSPYSWMLGDEQQRKSAFVATSPFASSSGARGAGGRRRKGSLFGGQDVDEDGGEGSRHGTRDIKGGEDDDDVFTMGALRANVNR